MKFKKTRILGGFVALTAMLTACSSEIQETSEEKAIQSSSAEVVENTTNTINNEVKDELNTQQDGMSETLKVIASRDAVRDFNPEQITDEELNTILMSGSLAPIGLGEEEFYKLTVIQDKELLRKINIATFEAFDKNPFMSDAMHGAPTLIVISTVKDRHPEMEGLEIASAACIADTMLIAATDMGLGSCYICNFVEGMKYQPELIEALGLPDGYEPVAGVLVGYPRFPIEYDGVLEQQLEVNYVR